MARRILGRVPGIGKRWPYRALNFLPSRQLWKYLAWKSRGRADGLGVEAPFHLGNALNDCRRILVILPDSFQEILLALPVLQSLVHDLPETEWQFLGNQSDLPFLAAIFEPDQLLGIFSEDLFWGETHFQNLEKTLKGFQPNLTVNLRRSTPPLLAYLVRASGANLRIQIGNSQNPSNQVPEPFANLYLQPVEPFNHLRRFILPTTLWNFSNRPITCIWSRLKPGPDHLREAHSRLTAKGLRPESTRVFLWQNMLSSFQQEVFQAAVNERHGPGESKSLVILTATGAPFFNSPPDLQATSGIPSIEVESTALLLGFLAQTARSIGLNGPVLHLASLTDTDVDAHFEPGDAPWDTSFLNPRLNVVYRKPTL